MPAWESAVACPTALPDQTAAAIDRTRPAASLQPQRRSGGTDRIAMDVPTLHPLYRAGAVDPRTQLRRASITHGARAGKPHIKPFARHHLDITDAVQLDVNRIGGQIRGSVFARAANSHSLGARAAGRFDLAAAFHVDAKLVDI